MTVLEIGAGAGQCSRWLARGTPGCGWSRATCRWGCCGRPAGSRRRGDRGGGGADAGGTASDVPRRPLPLLQCDGLALPLADASVDRVFTAYGVVPFVADSGAVLAEAARVLRPGGRFVFSTSHPVRWAFPDDPGPAGLTATTSYFDRTPYVESESGVVTYAEHHRTLGDLVRQVVAAGLVLTDLVEPEWPARNEATWGGWSPLRGRAAAGNGDPRRGPPRPEPRLRRARGAGGTTRSCAAAPPRSARCGDQPSRSRASVVSGRRTDGSSTGRSTWMIVEADPASSMTHRARSSMESSCGLPRLTGPGSSLSARASTPATRSST